MQNSTLPLPNTLLVDRLPAKPSEFVVTVSSAANESMESLFSRLAMGLKHREGSILSLMIYGNVAARDEATRVIRRYLGAIDWPVLWVEGCSCNGAQLAGVQAFAIRGGELERVLVKGRIVGTIYEDADVRHCLLGGIGPDDVRASHAEQAFQTFENLTSALSVAGFELPDVARTWFYNDNLLGWYDDFNRVRTSYYSKRPFRSGSVPASTAVEGRNPQGAALTIGAWALQSLNGAGRVQEVASPLQCPAPNYGSSFSRAMEIESAGRRRLLVSGTASIAPEGHTVWQGDIGKQVALTMDVVEAMLQSRGMGFGDVTRATAYFKHAQDTTALDFWQGQRGLALPAVYVNCDICRDDLLFEIELDAVAR